MEPLTIADLATRIGRPVEQVISVLAGAGAPLQVSDTVMLPLEDQYAGPLNIPLKSELVELILSSFESARLRKSDWQQMTAAVLKNRLLQATAGRFSERNWGFRSINEMVQDLPGIVELDTSHVPPLVQFVGDRADLVDAVIVSMHDRVRVRRDLWYAILDYSSGHEWAWNGQVAVSAEVSPGAPRFPTVNENELRGIRQAFANSISDEALTVEQQLEVHTWWSEALSANNLPPGIRGTWYEHLKKLVVDKLEVWFHSIGEPLPNDLLVHIPRVDSTPRQGDRNGPQSLRRLLALCVQALTDEEVRLIQMPTSVVYRVLKENPKL